MQVIRANKIVPVLAEGAPPPLLLTLTEVARELRCSRAKLYDITRGRLSSLPSLPVFHIGRRVFVRRSALIAWILDLEVREREANYVSNFCGLRDDELEFIAGA